MQINIKIYIVIRLVFDLNYLSKYTITKNRLSRYCIINTNREILQQLLLIIKKELHVHINLQQTRQEFLIEHNQNFSTEYYLQQFRYLYYFFMQQERLQTSIQMQQEQSQSVIFQNDQEKQLYEILANKIRFQETIYTQQDFKVDLVIRIPFPETPLIHKTKDLPYNEMFFNTPPSFQQAYETARDYIKFSMDSYGNNHMFKQSMTKGMTSMFYQTQSTQKNKIILLDGIKREQMTLSCNYHYYPELDIFTIRYNMIVVILQKICGFRVKSFVLEDDGKPCLYLLLYQSIQNMLLLASRYKIKKQVNMIEIDFQINHPTDQMNRPLKINSFLLKDPLFEKRQKYFSRLIGTNSCNLKRQIIEEIQISNRQKDKYLKYLQQYEELIKKSFLNEKELNFREKQYVFKYNRGKINEGCYNRLRMMNIRKQLYQQIIKLNQKYCYPSYKFQNAFFQFRLPTKTKSFFNRLQQLLVYKTSVISPSGELQLFNKMQRTKLSYLCLQEYLKLQNLSKFGLQIFAINDNFEKFGQITYEHIEGQPKVGIKGGMDGDRLIDKWHGFIPFLTNIRFIRDYMGQNTAFSILVKTQLITFFAAISPLSLLAQFIGSIFYVSSKGGFIYQFSIGYLIVIIICLTIFQQLWTIKQKNFEKHFIAKNNTSIHREQYKGPFIRNIITDNLNEYTDKLTLWNRVLRFFTFIGLGILILVEAFFFYGLRKSILQVYQRIPDISFQYISLPHLIFYGVFFWSNFLIYRFVFSKIIIKLIDFQNFSTKEEHFKYLRAYTYIFTFGVQLLGPIFIYIIEPLMGKSCNSSSCILQFQNYVYSRYLIIFSFIIVKMIYTIFFYFKGGIQEITFFIIRQFVDKKEEINVQEKFALFLKFIQKQYTRQQITFDLREQALSIYYYCIYSIVFPFCSILGLGILILDYILIRIQMLRDGRRPISTTNDILRLSDIYSYIIHICIIVNSWSIFCVQEIIGYNFTFLIQYFVTEINRDNILMLNIVLTFFLIIFLEVISALTKRLLIGLRQVKLQQRKTNMFNQYLFKSDYKINDKRHKIIGEKIPLKSIFRTFEMQSLGEMKKSRFKFRRPPYNLTQQINEKFYDLATANRKSIHHSPCDAGETEQNHQQQFQETQTNLSIKYMHKL